MPESPLRLGTAAEFAAAREFLNSPLLAEAEICKLLHVDELYQYDLGAIRREIPAEISDVTELYVRLFLEGRYLQRDDVDRLASAESGAALESLGLVESDPAGASRCFSPVTVYPVRSLWIASDRWSNPDLSSFTIRKDAVYPALVRNTRQFLDILPETSCESFLDLCAGTGIAAFDAASRYARHALALDVAERSVHFAEFNRRLNGIENAAARTGDVYEPVRGETFDRIVAHPPYVPVLEPKWIYHGGGEDGEEVTRKTVEGLPVHLRPGGSFYCLAIGTDRAEGPFEQRLRGWLGHAQQDFDVAVIVRVLLDPAMFAVRQYLRGFGEVKDMLRWKETFQRLHVNTVLQCAIVIQRRTTERPVFTLRRKWGVQTTPAEIHWMIRWETAALENGFVDAFLLKTLSASPRSRLTTEYALAGGDWQPCRHTLQSDYPFAMDCENGAFLAALIPRLSRPQTGTDLFEDLKREGVIAPGTPPADFARALAILVSGGFLDSEAFPLPHGSMSGGLWK